jgi:hypothetical protein
VPGIVQLTRNPHMSSVKEAAKAIIDHLPENASWDDLMYEL